MAGTGDVTFGGSGFFPGMVTISASSLFGSLGSSSVNELIQTFLTNVTDAVTASGINFANWDLPAGAVLAGESVVGGNVGGVDQFTNMTTGGGTTAGSAGAATVGASSDDVLVQFTGNVTLNGNAGTTTLVIGDSTNANYTVTDAAAGTMYLAGGANSVTLYSTTTNNAETIYSAGKDTINLVGQGTDYVSVYGNAVINDEEGNAYVTAEGNATTNLYWDNANAGGSLNFINNSSAAARVQIGEFYSSVTGTWVGSPSHVTAFGGAGGGLFVGGTAGNNSLVGGTGAVTLIGAGNGDYLAANSSLAGIDGSGNDFFAGSGSETMVASSTTGANLFQVGLKYPGVGLIVGNGMISTSGSGQQTYFLGNSPGETIYASTNTGANYNLYNFVSDSAAGAGGGTFDIYNFSANHNSIDLVNITDNGAGDAHILSMGADPNFAGQYDITLSDHTTIRLHNFTGSLSEGTITGGIISLY